MLPDVINGQAHCLYIKMPKMFKSPGGILQTNSFLKYNSSCIE